MLSHLDIELTERCNNDCIHCCINMPADDLEAKSRELTATEVKAILKEAASLGALTVCFTGGEPLLRDDFEEIYVFARKLGLKVILFTNARRITPEIAALFSRIPPMEKIEVSAYGMRKDSYEAVTRSAGSFEEFKQGIRLLLDFHIPFLVKGAILPPNFLELDAFEAWSSTISWMDGTPKCSMFFDLRLRRDSEAKNELIKALRISPKNGVKIMTRRRNEYVKGMKQFCQKFMHPPEEKLFGCGAGLSVSVDAYGMAQPCLLLRHPQTTYNLKKGSLSDALTHFFPRLRQAKAENPDYLARCARCFLKGLCEQCPGKSWTEHGTLDRPVEYLCRIAHAQAQDLGLLREGENAWEIENWTERIDWISN